LNLRHIQAAQLGEITKHRKARGWQCRRQSLSLQIGKHLDVAALWHDDSCPEVEHIEEIDDVQSLDFEKRDIGEQRAAAAELIGARRKVGPISGRRLLDESQIESVLLVKLLRFDDGPEERA